MSVAASVQSPPQAAGLEAVHSLIGNYYSAKVRQFGPTPWGVDWACMPSQELRFVQLLKLCPAQGDFSINDVGCGYGALLGFLDKRFKGRFDYFGVDISADMVREARGLWARHPQACFAASDMPPRRADYSVASGIFNVCLEVPRERWELFVRRTLCDMHTVSAKGFAVNFLAPLAAGAVGQRELYRAAPAQWRGWCEAHFDADVEVIGAYGMREYTLLVRPRA